ncbi:lipopolysaccharide kinase InaA family protein [Pseudomonas chlororaphis]|uniref:Lipopolysaccharide kinase n=1 Tax=Pseudomonas chlororaphis TaxID=587753 RepID=A0A1Q8EWM3_9PSED|nr:lipopolysaccharide kinase InaA family protein [Pseudomonas chlororaphis]OLF56198.1 lipopolysaccharide kinase [Pseudomonas chlororaphis]
MTDYLAAEDRALLERHGLASFDALWAKQLDAVDEPNTAGGGWSSVYRLDLEGHGYYLKRQSNYLTRTLHRPFGEPTFAREFRNISRYRQLGIPALQAVFFGERKVAGETRAILLTRALDGWNDLDSLLQQWSQLSEAQHAAILRACGLLARQLHGLRQVHGCFYPKHIFLRATGDGYQAQLIDLEKTRPLLFGQRDRVKDLEPLLRRAPAWGEDDVRALLATYLEQPRDSTLVDAWLDRLSARRSHKETR